MQELPISQQQMAELTKIAATPAGRKLLRLLQQKQGPELKRALDTGDLQQAKAIVKSFMADKEAQALLKNLGR